MNGGGRGESAFKCVCVCLGFLGVCIILVCGGICACQWDCLRVRVCVYYGSVCPRHPLPPGFTTFCMQRLTTSPSNHILLSGPRRQQQQVV